MANIRAHDELDEKSSPTLTNALTHSDHSDPDKHRDERPTHLQVPHEPDHHDLDAHHLSPAESRDQATRLVDDLTLLQAERAVSNEGCEVRRSHSRVRTNDNEKEDVFNQTIQAPAIGQPPEPPSVLRTVYKLVRNLPRFIRYFLYCLPVTAILLIPIFLGIFLDRGSQAVIGGPGGVELLWFGIWLEVVWLSLWAARIATSAMPYALGLIAKITSSGHYSKWRDIGRNLELPLGLFLWLLAILISFLPIVNNHKVPARVPEDADTPYPQIKWIDVVNKVIIALFVLAVLNFAEKILIQWIATSFHMRTYSNRIEVNKQSIAYLVHLYEHSKDRLVSEAAVMGAQAGSGVRTPLGFIANNARGVATKIGDITSRVAGDFTGRQVKLSSHPRKVVSELLRNSNSAQVLARRLFRTYTQNGSDVLMPADLNHAFPTPEDAEAAFMVFDRDLNGDVSMEELEAFVDEVHREKKAIAASVKDLDSVITKLDRVFFVIIFIIALIVFISTISPYTAAALASAGTAVLGLAWVLQATAQEFLQSIIFVFVKHPFDVGDRVTIYGNTGSTLQGDDYYVTEISLLYTEFKKMQGHMVQAPNSVLNTLFILNHRRSGALADVFTLQIRYGTPSSVISELEARMTEYVLANKRDYNNKIVTELVSFEQACSMTVNFICFHKSSFQNELLRLTRHNKFAIELMNQMVALGIEQPRKQFQVSGRDFPIYQANISPPAYQDQSQRPPVDPAMLAATRRRANSRASDANDMFQDVFVARKMSNNNNPPAHLPPRINEEPASGSATGLRTSLSNLERPPTNGSGKGSNKGIFSRSMGTLRRTANRPSTERFSERADRDREIV
ncbi:putative mechanosensitive ion channel family protein [Rosellinia necatrix]|uniref:Mechanosensitive ion channel protein n=1 Tax=Rosellinia necatrix TaxID=77044 RepID=A0A1W2TQ68_ROSNE|nr:putative mechanosensitive ion channel family protein [Rosellinia necatrix]